MLNFNHVEFHSTAQYYLIALCASASTSNIDETYTKQLGVYYAKLYRTYGDFSYWSVMGANGVQSLIGKNETLQRFYNRVMDETAKNL